MTFYKETAKNGYFTSSAEKRAVFEAAQILFDYINELHKPLVGFYADQPQKAVDRASWPKEDIFLNNLWKDAREALFRARLEWRKSRAYIEYY